MAIVYHERFLEHRHWDDHPESSKRLESMVAKLKREGLWERPVRPVPAAPDDILLAHSERHLKVIQFSKEGPIDPDTMLRRHTYDIAALAVSAAIRAAKIAYEDEPSIALVRPPGHHAGPDYCGGFCFFNNIAVAMDRLDVKRAAIVDLDGHHGNGTQDIFLERDDVLFISMHQHGLYPGTGESDEVGKGNGEGFTVNVPFRLGAGDSSYRMAFDRLVEPVLEQYRPEIILVSLGVDAHYCDPTSGLKLTSSGYLDLTKRLFHLAPHRRIAFVLEGGYHLRATSEVVAGVVGQMKGVEFPLEYCVDHDEFCAGEEYILQTIDAQRQYWEL